MEPIELDPEDRELEQSLARLSPSPGAIKMESLWFAAGVAAARRRVNAWRASTAAAVILCVAILAFRLRPAPPGVERVVLLPQTNQVTAMADQDLPPAMDASYLRLRTEVLEKGLDALPASIHGSGNAQPTPRAWQLDPSMMQDSSRHGDRL